MELTRERLVIIIAGAIAIVLLGSYLFLYRPLINKCRDAGIAYRDIEMKILETREAISFLKQDTTKRIIISEKDVSLAIDELTTQGRSKGINFVSITPKEIKKSDDYSCKALPIEMEIESTYKDLGVFFGSTDDLEKSLVTVKNFSITPHKKDTRKLRTRLLIKMYLSSQNEE